MVSSGSGELILGDSLVSFSESPPLLLVSKESRLLVINVLEGRDKDRERDGGDSDDILTGEDSDRERDGGDSGAILKGEDLNTPLEGWDAEVEARAALWQSKRYEMARKMSFDTIIVINYYE